MKYLKRLENEKTSAQKSLTHQHDEMKSAHRVMNETYLHQMHYQMSQSRLDDDDLSSEMQYLQTLQRYEYEKQSSKKSRTVVVRNDDQGEQDIVRQLIHQQKFSSLWDIDEKMIVQLTGKSLADFEQCSDPTILMSAIVIVVLETRFASLSSMWHGIVQKMRKRLIDMLDKDPNQLNALLDNIRKQL